MQNDRYSPLQLFNLKADPYEKTDLANEKREMFNELSAALRQHIQRGGTTAWQRTQP
jgi:hypothetical protein